VLHAFDSMPVLQPPTTTGQVHITTVGALAACHRARRRHTLDGSFAGERGPRVATRSATATNSQDEARVQEGDGEGEVQNDGELATIPECLDDLSSHELIALLEALIQAEGIMRNESRLAAVRSVAGQTGLALRETDVKEICKWMDTGSMRRVLARQRFACTAKAHSPPAVSQPQVGGGSASGGTGRRERLEEQQQAINRVAPFIVQMYDAYTDPDERCIFLVLEYMSAGALDKPLKAKRRLNESQLGHIALSCLSGIRELHARRLMHRDIKPSNILLDHLGRVKLSDFGILREFDEESLAHTFTGTIAFMSPERVAREDYSYPADIWGLGLSLLTLALGRNPLAKYTEFWDVATAIQEDRLPSLRPEEGFSAELGDLVECCLRKDPKMRLTAEQLLRHPFAERYRTLRTTICPFEPPPSDLARAKHMLGVIVRHVNDPGTEVLPGGVSPRHLMRHAGDGPVLGVSRAILKRLATQVPGIDFATFDQLHNECLREEANRIGLLFQRQRSWETTGR